MSDQQPGTGEKVPDNLPEEGDVQKKRDGEDLEPNPSASQKPKPNDQEAKQEEDEEDEDAFDHKPYITAKEEWIQKAKKAIREISIKSGAFTLSTFYSESIPGRYPEHTLNMTCGHCDEDILKSVTCSVLDGTDIEYEQRGVCGGGIPGSDFGQVSTAADATEWLLLERPRQGPPKVFLRPKVYLRLWPFNIFDGESWPIYTHNKKYPDLVDYNDLEDVGLLEGAWYEDDKEGQKELEAVVKELETEFRSTVLPA